MPKHRDNNPASGESRSAIYRRILPMLPREIVYVVVSFDEEGPGSSVGYQQQSRFDALSELDSEIGLAAIDEIESYDDFKQAVFDGFDSWMWSITDIITPEERDRKKAEARRMELESKAREIAANYNCQVGTMDFIRAVEMEIAGAKRQQFAMVEDGLCSGYGITVEQWFDDHNYLGSQIGSAADVLDWLESECPLLMMKYREEKLREEKEETDA